MIAPLLGAYAQGARQVTPAIVDHAAVEALGNAVPVTWHERLRRRLPRVPLMWIEGTLACVGLILAGILLQNAFGGHATNTQQPPAQVTQRHPSRLAATAENADTSTAALPVAASSSASAPASSQNSDASPAPTPADITRAGLGAVLEHPESIGDLMGRLIAMWNPKLRIPPGENVCAALAQAQLQCDHDTAHWTDLDQMNRPAILTLSLGRGDTQYVLLRHLGDNSAVLDTAGGPLKVSLTQLGAAWNGEFLLLWKNGADTGLIGPDSRGQSIIWLRRKLAAANGQSPPVDPVAHYGPQLRNALMAYQSASGLQKVDGLAGTQTLMSLSAIGHEDDTPMLHPPR